MEAVTNEIKKSANNARNKLKSQDLFFDFILMLFYDRKMKMRKLKVCWCLSGRCHAGPLSCFVGPCWTPHWGKTGKPVINSLSFNSPELFLDQTHQQCCCCVYTQTKTDDRDIVSLNMILIVCLTLCLHLHSSARRRPQ